VPKLFGYDGKSPADYVRCRTRWSCTTLALTLEARRGWQVAAETVRRWLHSLGRRRKWAKLLVRDPDPQRAAKLAQICIVWEILRPRQALLFADKLEIHLLRKSGYR
jgi:hypothetical protein